MATDALTERRRARLPNYGLVTAAVLMIALWAFTIGKLVTAWQSDSALSHGPLLPVLAGALLWARRDQLKVSGGGASIGLAIVFFAGALNVLAGWGDIVFLRSAALVLMLIGFTWAIAGSRAGRAAAGPLGLLLFMIPWPTTLVERLTFPMQLLSSKYAAMLIGMLGIPIKRTGIALATPDYQVLVAEACSGITSLGVLLALGYLLACVTRLPLWAKLTLFAVTAPLALFTNTIRVALIVIAGHLHSETAATWIHDHEAPVLLLFCGVLLMTIRSGLLQVTVSASDDPDADADAEAEGDA